MKKKLSRLLSLMLAMVMALSVTAMAEESVDTPTENSKATIITGADGATVTFDQAIDPETGKKIPEKIQVTYEKAGLSGQYLIMMVTATEEKDPETGKGTGVWNMDSIGESTILYIDQVGVGDADEDAIPDISFTVYPETLKSSIIMIYGVMPDGSKSLKAAIVKAKFIIGDVNGDGKVSTADLIRLAQFLVGNNTVSAKEAADTNADNSVGAADLIRLAKFLVGNASLG